MIETPLWLDGWEAEADRKAGLPPGDADHAADDVADNARSHRPIHNVIRSL